MKKDLFLKQVNIVSQWNYETQGSILPYLRDLFGEHLYKQWRIFRKDRYNYELKNNSKLLSNLDFIDIHHDDFRQMDILFHVYDDNISLNTIANICSNNN